MHANLTSRQNHILPHFFNIDTQFLSLRPLSFSFLIFFPLFQHSHLHYVSSFCHLPIYFIPRCSRKSTYMSNVVSVPLTVLSNRLSPSDTHTERAGLPGIHRSIHPRQTEKRREGRGGKRGSRSTISRDNRYRSSSTWFKLAFDSFSARDTRYIILVCVSLSWIRATISYIYIFSTDGSNEVNNACAN